MKVRISIDFSKASLFLDDFLSFAESSKSVGRFHDNFINPLSTSRLMQIERLRFSKIYNNFPDLNGDNPAQMLFEKEIKTHTSSNQIFIDSCISNIKQIDKRSLRKYLSGSLGIPPYILYRIILNTLHHQGEISKNLIGFNKKFAHRALSAIYFENQIVNLITCMLIQKISIIEIRKSKTPLKYSKSLKNRIIEIIENPESEPILIEHIELIMQRMLNNNYEYKITLSIIKSQDSPMSIEFSPEDQKDIDLFTSAFRNSTKELFENH